MFSTDHNVEKLADLIVIMKDYVKLQANYLQLNATEKTIKILSLIVLSITIWFFFLLALIVAGVHMCIFIVIYLKRHSWIEKPLVKRIANILLNKTPQ